MLTAKEERAERYSLPYVVAASLSPQAIQNSDAHGRRKFTFMAVAWLEVKIERWGPDYSEVPWAEQRLQVSLTTEQNSSVQRLVQLTTVLHNGLSHESVHFYDLPYALYKRLHWKAKGHAQQQHKLHSTYVQSLL